MSLTIYASGHAPNMPSYKFYNNTVELFFDKSTWTYFRVMPDGSREPQNGVTGVCKIIDKSAPLMAWAVKKSMAKLRALLLERGYAHPSADQEFASLLTPLYLEILDELIVEAKKADREELEAAAETGHIAHDWIEQYIRTVIDEQTERRHELLAKLPLDTRAANACIAAIEWMSVHNVRWISTERKCFSLMYGYAGTMDGLALVDSCTDTTCCPHAFKDRLTLVDWKTSNYLYIEYLLQTAAYQQAHQEETGETIEDRWIIRLGKDDAEFDPWHVEGENLFNEDLHGFLNALSLYKSVHNIEDRIIEVKSVKSAERKRIAKLLLDAERAIKCQEADTYKGSRKKKGCNGKDVMCEACTKRYQEKHG